MSRLLKIALALSASSIPVMGLSAASAHAATPPPSALLVGKLGIEGGAYPGKFHPTSGSVEVEFDNQPLALEKSVGPSGRFKISLSPGKYTVIGCGPTASSGAVPRCSKAKNITLAAGEVDHIRLIWLLAP